MGTFPPQQCCTHTRPVHYHLDHYVTPTIDETRLITCQGPVYVRAPTSYHAK